MTAPSDLQLGLNAFQQKDYQAALRLLSPIAKVGNAEAQCILGNIYQLGLGVPADISKAVQWYQRSSAQGYGVATNNLAGIVGHGYSENAPDPDQATRLYQEARAQGFIHAPQKYPY